jgi:uncharacterized protein (TIGR02145 family)
MKIKRIITLTALAFAFSNTLFSQVGIGTITPDPSAELDVTSTSKGFLLPRMTTTDRGLISSPAKGLMIFNTTTSTIEVNVGTPVSPNWQATSGGSLPAGTSGQTLRHNGTTWVSNSTVFNDGTNVGVGTDSPLSNLDIQGSMGLKFTTITAATTLNQTHNVVLCNSGPYTVTLPAAASNTGKVYYIKNISSTNVTITLDGNASETIDGSTTFNLGSYKHAVRIICDGSNWHVLENSGSKLTTSTFTTTNCDASGMAIIDVLNPTTGKIWMDRNLGASRVATSSSDANSYGELYQWGRLKDGHQCRASSTTATQSSTDIPGNANFITGSTNWRSTTNDNLWQGVSGINNPCPSGYRLPTAAEWAAEAATWSTQNQAGAFASPLKLPLTGERYSTGVLNGVAGYGMHWSSTVSGTDSNVRHFDATSTGNYAYSRASGMGVRCIKD